MKRRMSAAERTGVISMAGFMSDFFRFWPVLVLIRLNRNDAGSSGLVPRTPAGHRCWRATPVDGHHRRAPRADQRRARTADPGQATAQKEERRVGKEGGRRGRTGGSPEH